MILSQGGRECTFIAPYCFRRRCDGLKREREFQAGPPLPEQQSVAVRLRFARHAIREV